MYNKLQGQSLKDIDIFIQELILDNLHCIVDI